MISCARDTGLPLLFPLIVLLFLGCGSDAPVDPPDTEAPGESAYDRRGRGAAGNHLSQPVLWSDGYALPLPGAEGVERFDGSATEAEGDLWYHQRDEGNEWRAASADGGGEPVDVTFIEWGNNLEAKPWSENGMVRIEVALVRETAAPMTAYEMRSLDGRGPTEVWGTNGVTYLASEATVYSHGARLVIQKLPADPDGNDLAWDADECAWIGAGAPLLSSGVWASGEGPTAGLSAEVNGAGRLIYGHNWDLRKNGEGAGVYRITFALDAVHGVVPLNTFFETTRVRLAADAPEEDHAGGVAVVDPALDLSYMDVRILSRPGGGGGSGGGCGGEGEAAGARTEPTPTGARPGAD